LHGWGSDGINPNGCPDCDQVGRAREKKEIARLGAQVDALKIAVPLVDEQARARNRERLRSRIIGKARRLRDEADNLIPSNESEARLAWKELNAALIELDDFVMDTVKPIQRVYDADGTGR
jgi:hypothetical protein